MDPWPRPAWVLSLCVGCYSPTDAASTGGGADDDASDSTDGPTTGSGTTPTTSSPTTTSPGDTDPADTTQDATSAGETAGDAPPELSNFSVNGSDSPSEILEADTVEIQVAAMDDVGIERVEFYDGDELVATFTEPPYRTEFLVTSTDNGGHSYTAVAYDTSEQTAEAGPIPLSVSIDGGAVLELQDAGFEAVALIGLGPHPLVNDDTVLVVGNDSYEGADFTTARLVTSRFSLGLSNTEFDRFPASVTSATLEHIQFARGFIREDGSALVPVAIGPFLSEAALNVFQVPDGGSASSLLQLGASSYESYGGLASTTDGPVVAVTGPAEISLYDSGLDAQLWSTDVSSGLDEGGLVRRVATFADGSITISGIVGNASGGSFLRKLAADGDIIWTRTLEDGVRDLPAHAVSSTGDISVVISVPTSDGLGLRVVTYDANGTELSDATVEGGTDLALIDATYDAEDNLVACGLRNAESGDDAWVGRFTPAGDEVWSVLPDLGFGASTATGLAVNANGRLYVTGMRDTEVDFVVLIGIAWVAELAL